MTGEVWRIVPSVPFLMVSSEGRIMRVPTIKQIARGGTRQYGGTPTWGVWSKPDGRFITVIHGHTYKVARLVAEAFHGSPPDGCNVVMHIDDNAANNRAANLKWGTQKENLNSAQFLAYCEFRTGDQNPLMKARKKQSLTVDII